MYTKTKSEKNCQKKGTVSKKRHKKAQRVYIIFTYSKWKKEIPIIQTTTERYEVNTTPPSGKTFIETSAPNLDFLFIETTPAQHSFYAETTIETDLFLTTPKSDLGNFLIIFFNIFLNHYNHHKYYFKPFQNFRFIIWNGVHSIVIISRNDCAPISTRNPKGIQILWNKKKIKTEIFRPVYHTQPNHWNQCKINCWSYAMKRNLVLSPCCAIWWLDLVNLRRLKKIPAYTKYQRKQTKQNPCLFSHNAPLSG